MACKFQPELNDRAIFRDYNHFDEHLDRNGFFPIYNIGIPTAIDTLKINTLFLVEGGFQYLDPRGDIISMLSKRFDTADIIEYGQVIKLYRFFHKKPDQN